MILAIGDFKSMLLRITFLLLIFTASAFPQATKQASTTEIAEISDIVQNIPDWETAKDRAKYIRTSAELKKHFPTQPVIDLISFKGGVESVTADYEQGRLLIVEYPTPQMAIEADLKFNEFFAQNLVGVYYRKIGNYSVFLFGTADEQTAAAFIDRIDYGKTVQWLGEDPYYFGKVEKYYAETLTGALVSSFLFIGIAIAATTVLGLLLGVVLFYRREKTRHEAGVFSDAGGMTRLNIDDLIE
jgi:hypothetical protein